MAVTIYGARLAQSPVLETDIRYDVLGADSEVFAAGDILTVDSGVASIVDAATEPIYGVVAGGATMGSTNDTKYVAVVPADNDKIWFMGCNAALTDNETDYGTFYSITGATAVMQVDVNAGVKTTTSRQVMIVKVDPYNVGGTDGPKQAFVKFVRTPLFNGAFN